MKTRLDELLVLRQFAPDIKRAQSMICAGIIFVDGKCSDKVGNIHNNEAEIITKEKCRYVSRGGLKLEEALLQFKISVDGTVCIDIGASTGGFTDCLLQHGARKIYAVDVAYGQFSWKLRQDERVIVIERFNARKITIQDIPDQIDIAVIDASFISLKTLIPPLIPLFGSSLKIIALIKPQFELPKGMVEKGGVVREEQSHKYAIASISQFAEGLQLLVLGVVPSPLLGPKGNKEYLIYLESTL